jgi:two-component system, OmpR family, response regulator
VLGGVSGSRLPFRSSSCPDETLGLAVRVLVVEDKVKLATVLSRGLRKAGLSADVSATGEDAIWMAASTPYDAVILDVMLPGIDGFGTCRRLRSEAV